MQTRSGSVYKLWPTPRDVKPLYHNTYDDMMKYLTHITDPYNLTNTKLAILEVCETFFLNKHLIVYSEKWEMLLDIIVDRIQDKKQVITTFKKADYIRKLKKLRKIDYKEIKDTFDPIKKELMEFYYHPNRVRKYLESNQE